MKPPPSCVIAKSMRGAEIKEGIKASAEKRPPQF